MWNFKIIKSEWKIWISEIFYQSKKKIFWYSDFLLSWESKQEILNRIKNLIIENSNFKESEQVIELEKHWWLWSKEELRMMINDCSKKKIINMDRVKIWKKY